MSSSSTTLDPKQQHVLTLLAAGATVTAVAAAVGVHRNSISNWRRSNSAFRSAWAEMQYEQAMHWRDQTQSLAPLAIESIRQILADYKMPASVRLRAALAVHRLVITPAAGQPDLQVAPFSTEIEATLPLSLAGPSQQHEDCESDDDLDDDLDNDIDDDFDELDACDDPATIAALQEIARIDFSDPFAFLNYLKQREADELQTSLVQPPKIEDSAQ